MIKKLLLVLIGIVSIAQVFGQSPDPIISIPSPNTMSLGMMAEANVSMFTGSPNVSVPLYELSEGSLSVPISLSYNSAGVRPDVHPGWVGMGWALNAGGMITRKVNGMPDEFFWEEDVLTFDSNNSQFNFAYAYGYNYNYSALNKSNWSTSSNIEAIAKGEWKDSQSSGSGTYFDSDPDEFIFNFNGYSGKFMMDERGKVIALSNPALKVETEDTLMIIGYQPLYINRYISNIDAISAGAEIRIRGFKITTPDGVQYEFGMWNRPQTANSAIEASSDFFQEFYMSETWDTWYLVRMTGPNGDDVIDFSYIRTHPIASFGRTIAMEKQSGQTNPKGIFKLFGPVSSSSFSIAERFNGRMILPVYLSKIKSKNQEITFNSSVSSEKTYPYAHILNDLYFQSANSYRPNVHNIAISNGNLYDMRWFVSGRAPILAAIPNDPVTVFGTYYDNSTKIGFFERKDLPLGGGYNEAEIIDFKKLKWRKLDNIQVKSRIDNVVKHRFNLSYGNTSSQRLRLSQVQQLGVGGSNPPHKFTYEDYGSNEYSGTTRLPGYLSNRVDHWGYFNNNVPSLNSANGCFNNYNGCLKPQLQNYKSERNTNATYLYAGLLTKVTYPSGGYTHYKYEPHQYSKVVSRYTTSGSFYLKNQSGTAGGVRIKEIRHVPEYGAAEVVKTYEYSTGILGGEIQYFWPNYKGKLVNGNQYTADRFVSQSMLPVSSNSAGTHIGYSKVTEKIPGHGDTEYFYNNHDNAIDQNFIASIDPQKSPYSPFTDRSFMRGKIKEMKMYNHVDDLVRREQYYYTPNPEFNGDHFRAVATRQLDVLGGLAIEGTSYKVYNYPYNLDRKITTEYATGGNIVTTEYYEYNRKNFISEKRFTNSRGQVVKSTVKYPSDYYFGGPPFGPNTYGIAGLIVKNMWSVPIEKVTYVDNKAINGELNLFSGYIPTTRHSKTLKLTTNQPLTNFQESVVTYSGLFRLNYDSRYEVVQSFDQYDANGNLITSSTKDNISIGYKWGYNDEIPIAKASNATGNEFAYDSFESGSGATNDANAKTGKRVKNLNGSKFRLKATPTKTRNYVMTYYHKSSIGGAWSLKRKAVNNYTGAWVYTNESTGYVDEVRLHPVDAQVSTYTYDPLVGMTSQSDQSSITTYYEYDNLHRVNMIRDDQKNITKKYAYNYDQNYARRSGTTRTADFSQTVLDFGEVLIGSSRSRSFVIKNNGNSSLSVQDIEMPVDYTVNWSGGSIGAGASRTVTVTFRPTKAGANNRSATVASNKTHGMSTVSFTATALVPTRILRLSPSSMNFGTIDNTTTKSLTWRIYNDGNATLNVSSISVPSGFTVNWSGGNISAGSSRAVTVTFRPTQIKTYSGTITVSSNKTSGGNTTSVTGVSRANTSRIIALSGNMNFGSVNVGSSTTRTLTIRNNGNGPLQVFGILSPIGFSASWSGTINPGQSRNVTVTFSPPSNGIYQGELGVGSDANGGDSSINLTGFGGGVFEEPIDGFDGPQLLDDQQ
ncbi:MAG: choice-of-anchor D domain-containing protein [bacterium]|nr:choice-of-anchor D domain-containing protein [bacterium]